MPPKKDLWAQDSLRRARTNESQAEAGASDEAQSSSSGSAPHRGPPQGTQESVRNAQPGYVPPRVPVGGRAPGTAPARNSNNGSARSSRRGGRTDEPQAEAGAQGTERFPDTRAPQAGTSRMMQESNSMAQAGPAPPPDVPGYNDDEPPPAWGPDSYGTPDPPDFSRPWIAPAARLRSPSGATLPYEEQQLPSNLDMFNLPHFLPDPWTERTGPTARPEARPRTPSSHETSVYEESDSPVSAPRSTIGHADGDDMAITTAPHDPPPEYNVRREALRRRADARRAEARRDETATGSALPRAPSPPPTQAASPFQLGVERPQLRVTNAGPVPTNSSIQDSDQFEVRTPTPVPGSGESSPHPEPVLGQPHDPYPDQRPAANQPAPQQRPRRMTLDTDSESRSRGISSSPEEEARRGLRALVPERVRGMIRAASPLRHVVERVRRWASRRRVAFERVRLGALRLGRRRNRNVAASSRVAETASQTGRQPPPPPPADQERGRPVQRRGEDSILGREIPDPDLDSSYLPTPTRYTETGYPSESSVPRGYNQQGQDQLAQGRNPVADSKCHLRSVIDLR